MGPRAGLDGFREEKISCCCRDSDARPDVYKNAGKSIFYFVLFRWEAGGGQNFMNLLEADIPRRWPVC